MPAKKSSRKAAAKPSGGARQTAAARSERVSALAKELEASKELSSEFVANPARVAKQYGVTLSREEEFAVRFVSGLQLATLIRIKLPGPLGFFDNNCGCPGPGPASW